MIFLYLHVYSYVPNARLIPNSRAARPFIAVVSRAGNQFPRAGRGRETLSGRSSCSRINSPPTTRSCPDIHIILNPITVAMILAEISSIQVGAGYWFTLYITPAMALAASEIRTAALVVENQWSIFVFTELWCPIEYLCFHEIHQSWFFNLQIRQVMHYQTTYPVIIMWMPVWADASGWVSTGLQVGGASLVVGGTTHLDCRAMSL